MNGQALGSEVWLPWWGYLLLALLFTVWWVVCKRDGP
jgi:hypothetical protein